ncbi:hypothetical protein A3J34_00285 [Candidatus Peribacteria bacterium RIFCSPLOWO2_02_FULL_51_10]|nr:MAG: hypothetical protein A3J34_00285 [Candidatus Peribacteria bacterium RIFCSPLOWO2_02_FULL_51_10]
MQVHIRVFDDSALIVVPVSPEAGHRVKQVVVDTNDNGVSVEVVSEPSQSDDPHALPPANTKPMTFYPCNIWKGIKSVMFIL